MTSPIFDKSNKGREEIATRKHGLALRLRPLLLLIDGKQSRDDILKKVAGLGLNEDSINDLLNNGFIEQVATASEDATPAPAEPDRTENAVEPAPVPVLPEGETQYAAIYHFYTETIKSTLGLRGYALQLKVERASSIDEFRQLRKPYLEAVQKAKGNEMARSLRARLDELLYYGETPPSTTIVSLNTGSSE
jgi:hypothetical protein